MWYTQGQRPRGVLQLAKRKPSLPRGKGPKRPLRDAYGRFRARGAPPKPPPAPRARGATGRFLDRDAREASFREQLQRAAEFALMSPEERAQRIAADLRVKEVKREKQDRRRRAKSAPSKYKSKTRESADRKCRDDQKLIHAGQIPKPTQEFEHGNTAEYIWLWQGSQALETAQAFLLHLSSTLPADARCYLSVGNGFDANSQWIGTRLDTPRNVWFHSQTFLSSQSGNAQYLERKVNSQDYQAKLDLWAEVKLITKGTI